MFFNLGPTWITELQHLCNLIECFAGSVIESSADQFVIIQAVRSNQHRVTAAHDERNIRADRVFLCYAAKEGREQMPFEMIDREVRPPKADGQSFGKRRANHQRAREARSA